MSSTLKYIPNQRPYIKIYFPADKTALSPCLKGQKEKLGIEGNFSIPPPQNVGMFYFLSYENFAFKELILASASWPKTDWALPKRQPPCRL